LPRANGIEDIEKLLPWNLKRNQINEMLRPPDGNKLN